MPEKFSNSNFLHFADLAIGDKFILFFPGSMKHDCLVFEKIDEAKSATLVGKSVFSLSPEQMVIRVIL